MPVIYPSIQCGDALVIINKMRRLRSRRYTHEITRQAFLTEWDRLRTALNETEEYKSLRRLLFARSGGICEKCKKAPGEQMCHKLAVAHRPELALKPSNVYLGCLPCHQLDHPDLQLVK